LGVAAADLRCDSVLSRCARASMFSRRTWSGQEGTLGNR
jgi:hypothetical protein